ncbi:unnamed protein product [Closterium sp. NIES-54]
MARFAGESGMRPFLSTDGDAASTASGDAASDAINDAVSDAGAETFLFPTPPRSPREGSRAALGFRHRRRWNSFSGAQELPGGCGVCDAPESLDGATNGDIAYYGASTNGVTRISGGEENTRSAEERCDLTRLPRPSAAHYSAPPAAAAAVAAAGATSPLPAESLRRSDQIYGSKSNAMWPRSQSHSAVVGRRDPSDGSDTMGGRRLGRHRRIRSVEAIMEASGVAGQATTTVPPLSPFPRVYLAVQSPHGLRRESSVEKQSQSPHVAAACSLKTPHTGPAFPASLSSTSPLSPPPLSSPPLSPPPLSMLSSSKPISLPPPSKPTPRLSRSKPVTGRSASGRSCSPDSYAQLNCNATSSALPTKATVRGAAAVVACRNGDFKDIRVQAAGSSRVTRSTNGNGKSVAPGSPSQKVSVSGCNTCNASRSSSPQLPKNERRVCFNNMVKVRTFSDCK